MSRLAVEPARSRIVLVGVSAYAGHGLRFPDVPAVAENLADLAAVFTAPELGGLEPSHCAVAPAEADAGQVRELLVSAAQEADDLLLFYFGGNAVAGSPELDLRLVLSGARGQEWASTTLAFDAVRDVFRASRATNRVVILDCGFSGGPAGETRIGDLEALEDRLQIEGTSLLTSPLSAQELLVEPGERHTVLTGRLLALLHSGSPDFGEMLTLRDIHGRLVVELGLDAFPEPCRFGAEKKALFGLIPNRGFVAAAQDEVVFAVPDPSDAWALGPTPAARNGGPPETIGARPRPFRPGRAQLRRRAAELLAEAERIVRGLDDRNLASRAQYEVTSLFARLDVDRAQRGVLSIPAGWARGPALAALVEALAPLDPDRAETLLGSLSDLRAQSRMTALLVRELAGTDPDRAERLARGLASLEHRERALIPLPGALAAVDFRRARRIARSMTYESARTPAQTELALAVVDDLRKARLVALSISNYAGQVQALGRLAVATAADPAQSRSLIAEAERIARRGQDSDRTDRALAELAGIVAATHPHRAEAVSEGIENSQIRVGAMLAIVPAMASADPDRAWQGAAWLNRARWKFPLRTEAVRAVAAVDPALAEYLAMGVSSAAEKVAALALVAGAVYEADPSWARRIQAEVGRVVRAEPGEVPLTSAAGVLAAALALGDPARAERVARTAVADDDPLTLCTIARTWIGAD